MYRVIVLIGLAASALLVLGCGGADEESSSTPLTKTQFIKQADQICAESANQRKAAVASFVKGLPGGAAEAQAHLDEGVRQVIAPSIEKEANELAVLRAPQGDTAIVSQMIDTLSKTSEHLSEEGSKGMSSASLPAFERAATAYGLKVCPNLY
jgi:hypothetical protein